MLLTVTPLENPGPPSPVPPPTAPKPNKDNARLQRLLRKASKRSGVQHPPSQPPKSFRSTLSPVSEADLESLESTNPKKRGPPPLTLPPRFQIRPVTHRVPSPYPKQRSFTFTVREQHSLSQYLTSPPPYETPSPRPMRASTPNTSTEGQPTSTTPKLFLQVANKHSTTLSTVAPASKYPNKSSSPYPAISELQGTLNGSHPPSTHTGAVLLSSSIKGNKDNDQDVMVTDMESRGFTAEPRNMDSGINTSFFRIGTVAETLSLHESEHGGTTQNPTFCSALKPEKAPQSVISPTSVFTEKSELLSLSSKVADIPHIILSVDSEPMDISEANKSTPDICHAASPISLGATQRKVTQVIKSCASTPVTPVPVGSPVSEKLPSTEELSLLKNPERAKPPRRKPGGGWARLVKHLVVEPDEPKFPEPQRTEGKEEKAEGNIGLNAEGQQQSRGSRANKMWDALLYHMATSPKQQEKNGPVSDVPPPLPFLRSRLPLLLHRPRFDARKLKEAASRPLRKVTAFFHRRSGERPLSSFNRTASGWSIREEDAEQLVGEGECRMKGNDIV